MVLKPLISRALAATLFVVGGGLLTLLSLLVGAPSFWYFPCFWVLIPLGILWCWRPSLAAALSVGPLVAAAAILRYQSGVWFGVWAACLIAAAIFVVAALRNSRHVVAALRNSRHWKVPLFISLVFLATAFCTDRLFTNKVTIKTFQMCLALDGKAPWGDVGPQGKDGTLPIVLYRRIGTSYCYVAFESQELRDRLAAKRGDTVTVEYNVFSDFGRERSYNVRSVDGILLHNGEYVVKDAERFGGQMLGDGGRTPNRW